MKNIFIKRVIALLTVGVLTFSLVSCTKTQDDTGRGVNTAEGGKLFSEPTEISILVGSHASWPYTEDWALWKYFREATGADFKVQSIPNSELNTKITLMMADNKSLPDMMHLMNRIPIDNFSLSGGYIAIDDYLDIMPNYTKFWDGFPEEERKDYMIQRVSADGKTYFPQVFGAEFAVGGRAWLYRKDIFEKHNLKTPETMDELYEVAKKLKELYPDSYPICMRTGGALLDVTSAQWQPYLTYNAFYDYDEEKWGFGATEPVMKDIVEYWIKLKREGLVPPDFLTINSKTWQELMSIDRGFITADYIVRIDFFNVPIRKENPDYTWSAMMPPRADSPRGQNLISKKVYDPTGYAVCNTGNQKGIENSIKVIDWLYSDEAMELLSWGKEGETYEVVDGKKQFILKDAEEDARSKYGVMSYGLYLRLDPELINSFASEEQNKGTQLAMQYMEEKLNPINWLSYSDEEMRIKSDVGTEINTYTWEMLSKFILEQEPMSKWDSFIEELYKMGLEEYLDMMASAYNRAKASIE